MADTSLLCGHDRTLRALSHVVGGYFQRMACIAVSTAEQQGMTTNGCNQCERFVEVRAFSITLACFLHVL